MRSIEVPAGNTEGSSKNPVSENCMVCSRYKLADLHSFLDSFRLRAIFANGRLVVYVRSPRILFERTSNKRPSRRGAHSGIGSLSSIGSQFLNPSSSSFEQECDSVNGIVTFTTFMFFCIPYISSLELTSEVHFVIKVATPFMTPPRQWKGEAKRGE